MSSGVGTQMNIMSAPQGTPALHWTIMNQGKYEILKILSDVCQEDLKLTDQIDNTILHFILLNQSLSEKDIIELLEVFIDRGSDINAENKHGKAVIHFAVNRRMRRVVELMTRRKAKVDKRDRMGNSIAHDFVRDERNNFYELLKFDKYCTQMPDSKAEESESASFAEFLIEKGVDFEVRNDEGLSAFHLVIECNLQHILHVLVKHARDVRFTDHQKKSLLHLFFEKNAYDRNKLYKQGLRKLWYSDYASRYAASIVRILLDRGISTWPHDRDRNQTCLQTAIEYEEDMDIIEMLVDDRLENMGQNLAMDMFSELLESCARWGESRSEYFLKTLQSLIDNGADENGKDKSGITPIYRAVHGKNQQAVNFLNDCGADFRASNDNGENLFHALAKKGQFDKPATDECLEALFDLVVNKGCNNLNARNSTNDTPLHWAARCGNLAIAKKLIDNGADVNCKDVNGHTPLHFAVYHSQSEKLAELLLDSGADVNSKDEWGRRPLFFAAGESDESELVLKLLERGAYVNAHNDEESPFWEAIRCGHDSHVKGMLMYGADVNNIVASLLKSLQTTRYKPAREKQLVLQHWIKLKTANLSCSEKYEVFERKTREDCQQLYEDCLKEIEMLKDTFIDNCTSIYSFLRMNFGCRHSRMNNEKLRQLVQSAELEQQFPNYSVVILASYRQTVLWKSLLDPAKRAWLQLTNIELPDECIERIFAYLRNEDLVSMMEHHEDD